MPLNCARFRGSDNGNTDDPGAESVLKALKSGALHCLLILCVGFFPVTGFAAVDELHHPGGVCIDCDMGPTGGPVGCDAEFCAAAAASCGSHHGNSMIVTDFPDLTAVLSCGADATRGKDDFGTPPPSRIDRPPIA